MHSPTIDAVEIAMTDARINSQFRIDIAVNLFIFVIDSMLVLFIEKHMDHLYPPKNCSEPIIPPEYMPPSMPIRLAADEPPTDSGVNPISQIAINFLSCNIGNASNPAAVQAVRDRLFFRFLLTTGGSPQICRLDEPLVM